MLIVSCILVQRNYCLTVMVPKRAPELDKQTGVYNVILHHKDLMLLPSFVQPDLKW